MSNTLETGKKGEDIAKEYLISQGYKVIDTNWRAGQLEIDIIATHEGFLCIIEVKTRASTFLCEPEFAVNKAKQNLLIRAANLYLERNNRDDEIRFDIVSVVVGPQENRIELIQNAFYPTR